MLDLSERSRGEERGGHEHDGEHEPEAEACGLPLTLRPLPGRPPSSVEAIGALDCVRVERRPLLGGRRRLKPGHARSVGLHDLRSVGCGDARFTTLTTALSDPLVKLYLLVVMAASFYLFGHRVRYVLSKMFSSLA